jgi:uncharacterized membrane protein (DUF485 family)
MFSDQEQRFAKPIVILSMHFYFVISLLIARWIIYEEVAVYNKSVLVSVMLLGRILLSTPRSINPW